MLTFLLSPEGIKRAWSMGSSARVQKKLRAATNLSWLAALEKAQQEDCVEQECQRRLVFSRSRVSPDLILRTTFRESCLEVHNCSPKMSNPERLRV